MSDTATPSTLASVFILESDANSWTKLEGNGPLSQLHVKFWRKDMTEEAQEWRRSHPLNKDEFWDDIGPDCYALDFGIKHLERSKLWIRNDYLRIYDYCNQHYDTVKSFRSGIAPSVVITGQAGVGECSIPLVLYERLPSHIILCKKGSHTGSTLPSVDA